MSYRPDLTEALDAEVVGQTSKTFDFRCDFVQTPDRLFWSDLQIPDPDLEPISR